MLWDTGPLARTGVGRWITFYNHNAPTPPLADNRPPWFISARSKTNSRCRE